MKISATQDPKDWCLKAVMEKKGGAYRYLLGLSLCLFWAWGCASEPKKNDRFSGQDAVKMSQVGAGAFKLTWASPKAQVTRFHIFYNQGTQSNKGGKEIDSFEASPALLKAPTVLLNDTNIDPMPSQPGAVLCFYVVHARGTLRSEPSDAVCGKFD